MFGLDAWLVALLRRGDAADRASSSPSCSGCATRATPTTSPRSRRSSRTAAAAQRGSASPGASATRRRCSCSACRSCSGRPICPPRVEQSAEVTIGLVIMALALWLLLRWRRGAFAHDHTHLRVPPRRTPLAGVRDRARARDRRQRRRRRAAARGDPQSHGRARRARRCSRRCTAISMAMLSTGFGYVLGRPRIQRALRPGRARCSAPSASASARGTRSARSRSCRTSSDAPPAPAQ